MNIYLKSDRSEKPMLCFLVGLPRAGKSTYCHDWIKGAFPWQRPRVVISGDTFRKALHGHDYLPWAEGQVFASMDTAIRALMLSGFDVLVDETSTTQSTILRYLRIDIDAKPIFINTPVEACIERAIATNKPYLVEPIKRMNDQLQRLLPNWETTFERLKSIARSRHTQDIEV